ncbi:hypothetical protein NOVO_08440 [Rickettsiales bacterium Ac37b]|nr:hypothetical protein NOVO_08440 [Rickettsiales bacterium Ac37b]
MKTNQLNKDDYAQIKPLTSTLQPSFIDEFVQIMMQQGIYCIQPIIIDGNIHRFAHNGKGNKNCWYFLCPEGLKRDLSLIMKL